MMNPHAASKNKIEFKIKLAGVCIAVKANYKSTKEFCRSYITSEPEAFTVVIEKQDIDAERERSEREKQAEREQSERKKQTEQEMGRQQRQRRFEDTSDAYLETLALYRKIADRMISYNTLLFHGSVVAVNHQAYLFTAKSGTGKSTHTRLWRKYFGDKAIMINDDKPLLKVMEDCVVACGTPWAGKEHLHQNIWMPLKAICILERDETNHIEPVLKKDAWKMILQQSYRSDRPEVLSETIRLVEQIMDKTDLYRLGCNMSLEAVQVAYQGMQKE